MMADFLRFFDDVRRAYSAAARRRRCAGCAWRVGGGRLRYNHVQLLQSGDYGVDIIMDNHLYCRPDDFCSHGVQKEATSTDE